MNPINTAEAELAQCRPPSVRFTGQGGAPGNGSSLAVPESQISGLADDLVEAVDQPAQGLGGQLLDDVADPVRREGANLTDLDPRALRQVAWGEFGRQWEPCALGVARHGHGDDGARSLVEDIARAQGLQLNFVRRREHLR